MSSDEVVLATALAVLAFSVAWGAIVAWCAWKLGAKKGPPAGEG